MRAFSRRIAKMVERGSVDKVVYIASNGDSPSYFHGRCLAARVLLRSLTAGARTSLTFVAGNSDGGVRREFFALVDVLRDHLTSGGPMVHLSVGSP